MSRAHARSRSPRGSNGSSSYPDWSGPESEYSPPQPPSPPPPLRLSPLPVTTCELRNGQLTVGDA
eukprot:10594346-Alexandrium_andersonii.AAC.1